MARHADYQNETEAQQDGIQVENQNTELQVNGQPAEGAVADETPQTDTANADKKEEKPDTHKVEKGDTLLQIAARYGTSHRYLQRINNIEDPNTLKVGDVVKLRQQSAENS